MTSPFLRHFLLLAEFAGEFRVEPERPLQPRLKPKPQAVAKPQTEAAEGRARAVLRRLSARACHFKRSLRSENFLSRCDFCTEISLSTSLVATHHCSLATFYSRFSTSLRVLPDTKFRCRLNSFQVAISANIALAKHVPAILGVPQPPRGSWSSEVLMRVARLSLAVSSLFLILSSAQPARPGRQSASSSVSASQLFQQSLAALQGSTPIADVTLSGTARRIAGSDDETGTGVFKAISGASRVDLALSDGPRSEVENLTGATPAGSWSGPDAVSHSISYHNLMTDPSWFFPALSIARALSSSAYATSYVGQETYNGQSVQHLQIWQVGTVQMPPGVPTLQHLSQIDFYLDSTTVLPAAITFNTHPDNDMGLDLPIEIRFSGYQAVNGARIPFHVQKFLNNNLLLDLQFTNAQPNSGLSDSLFNVQ